MDAKSRCLECSWMGSVVYKPCEKCARNDADAELGRMVRAYFNRTGFVALEKVGERVGAWHNDEEPATVANTLNEAVRKALERGT